MLLVYGDESLDETQDRVCVLTGEMRMQTEIWQRLIQGKGLEGLGLGLIDGRVDLRGLAIPEPQPVQTVRTPIADMTKVVGITNIKGVEWKRLHFSSAQLTGLVFTDSSLNDCIFDQCKMKGIRVWATDFSNVRFRSVDLRNSLLGGTNEVKRTTYRNVEFVSADMRGTVYTDTEFTKCDFKKCRLDKVDFQSSAFVDCSFEGELREVLFYRRGFRKGNFPENEMTRIGFTRARLRWTEFRGLDLNDVSFPEDDEHIVIEDYPGICEYLIERLEAGSSKGAQVLGAVLRDEKKWLGKNQRVRILNERDILEAAGKEALETVLEVVGTRRRGSHNRNLIGGRS
jgi:uncharacterized protein YjbI with pentapeptide repeats